MIDLTVGLAFGMGLSVCAAQDRSSWHVQNWQVQARPAWGQEGQTALLTRGVRQAGAAGVKTEVAGIQIDVSFEADISDTAPSLWPGATAVQLLRSETSNGNYRVVLSLDHSQVQQPFTSADGIRTINGSRQPRLHFQFSLVDQKVEPGARYFYKVRFLGERETVAAESGFCSAIALMLPVATVEVDADGYVRVRWTPIDLKRGAFVDQPRLVIRLSGSHELARLPVTDNQFRTPFKATSASVALELALVFTARQDEWDSQAGQRTLVKQEELRRPIPAPATPHASREFRVPEKLECVSVEAVPSTGNAEGGRVQMIWRMPSDLRLISLEMQSRAHGTIRWTREDQSIYDLSQDNRAHEFPASSSIGMKSYTCGLAPGECEPVTYIYTWREHLSKTNGTAASFTVTVTTTEVGPVLTARVTAVRSPLPSGLIAAAGDGQVALQWSGFPWNKSDWSEGPSFVLLRAGQPPAGVNGNELSALWPEEILRTNASVTSFVDRGVTNGKLYFYTLRIEGVTHATSWCQDVGEYPCLVPVRVNLKAEAGKGFVAALPEGVRPLRVALLPVDTEDPRVNAIQAHCFRVLRAAHWMELVERSAGASLQQEDQVAKLQSLGTKPATAADIVLQCTVRPSGYHRMFDIWLVDFKNAHRERVLDQSLDDFALESNGQRLIQELATRYPAQAASFVLGAPQACAPIQTIAIAGFRPLSTNALAGGQFDTLLTTMIARDECVKVVEREKLALALKELAQATLSDPKQAVGLGRLVTADAILSGYYQVSNNTVTLSARLMDAGTGQIINIFELSGTLDDPQTLCRQLAQQVLTASKIGRPSTDSPLLRWMESQTYGRNSEKLAGSRTAAYVSPETPDHHFQMGTAQLQGGDLEDALASFYNGLALAENQEDPWRFYAAIGGLLDTLHRPEEAVPLWQRAAANCERRKKDASVALLNLARSERQTRNIGAAIAALDRIPPTSRAYEVGREYEALGRTNEALVVYGQGINQTPGPGYAALIRLLPQVPADVQIDILKMIAAKIGVSRPYQTRKALDELLRHGVALDANLIRLTPFLRGSDTQDPLSQNFEQIVRERPDGLEAMLALGQLADWNRKLGKLDASRKQFQRILAMKVRGEQADELRAMAEIRLRQLAEATPAASPLPEAKVVPRIVEVVASDADRKLVVDSAAIVYRLELGSGAVLWQFDPRARDVHQASRASPDGQPQPPSGPYSHSTSRLWYNSNYSIDHWISDLRLLAQSMVIGGDTLYAPNLIDGTLTALDVHSGSPRWTFVDWAPITKPLLFQGRLFVGNSLGWLYELDPNSGAVRRLVRYPSEFIERKYHEQLFKLEVSPSGDAISFIDPSRSGRYRVGDESKEMEFESHRFSLDFRTVAVGNLSLIPWGVLPDDVVTIEGSLVRVRVPRLASNAPAPGTTAQERAADVLSCSRRFGRAYLPELTGLLHDPAPEVRRTAGLCIGWLGDRSDVVALMALLHDPNETVRVQTVQSLGSLGGPEAGNGLNAALQDASLRVRSQAMLELIKAGDTSLVAEFKRKDPAGTWKKSDEALVALCKAGDAEAWEELEKELSFGYTGVELARSAELAARELPDPRLLPTLLQTLRRLHSNTLAPYIARAIGAIGDPSAVPELLAFIPYTTSGDGGKAFIAALEDLTGQSFGTDRGPWEIWWQSNAPRLLKTRTGE